MVGIFFYNPKPLFNCDSQGVYKLMMLTIKITILSVNFSNLVYYLCKKIKLLKTV